MGRQECHTLSIGGWRGKAFHPRRIRERLDGWAINWHSRALGSRSQRRGAGTNNNDPWQQSAHTVKETKSLLVVASGLTRLRCLVRVSRALSHETSFRFQQKLSSLELGSIRAVWRELAFIGPWRRQIMTSTFQTGTS